MDKEWGTQFPDGRGYGQVAVITAMQRSLIVMQCAAIRVVKR
jgi:hypothetical protein